MKRLISLFFALFVCLPSFAQTLVATNPASERQKALDRLQATTIIYLNDWKFHTGDIANAAAADFDDSSWSVMHPRDKWDSGTAWFRQTITVPPAVAGYDIRDARLRLDFTINGDDVVGLALFVNGLPAAQTENIESIPIVERAEPGQKLVIAIRVDSLPTSNQLMAARLSIDAAPGRPSPRLLWEELLSSQEMISASPVGVATREKQFDDAVSAIDFAALDRNDQPAFDSSLNAAHGKLQPLDAFEKQYGIHAVGNSHIDMAWLWPWTETVMVAHNTFASALQLMREYPDWVFAMGSAQTYEWMEEKYPEIFQQIKDRVKEGRWEIVGGMWVEPDLNMPTGESLVRQLLVGKRYFRQKFGVDVKVGWNPDSFGYNWQLPQIYKRSGIEYFVTQKMAWNDTTKFPYKLFWWQSPDGSKVLTYFPHDYVNPIYPIPMARDLAEYSQATGYPDMLFLFGIGDHGGGPTRVMLNNERQWQQPNVVYPKLNNGTALSYLQQLEKMAPKLDVPTWNNELYFQYHRGVLTTQSETKRRVRQAEEEMLNSEKLWAVGDLLSGGKNPYPGAQLTANWKKVLFEEFHDILPGSGIAVNYLDAARSLDAVHHEAHLFIHSALDEITAHVNTAGKNSAAIPVVVFNTLAWQRSEPAETIVQFSRPVTAIDVRGPDGASLPAYLVALDAPTNRYTVRFLAQDVPALGYRIFTIAPVAKPPRVNSGLTATADTLENEFVRVKVDPKNGCITSLFDKRSNSEALGLPASDYVGPKDFVCGNLLQAFVDKPKQWDAWNIDSDFEKEHWDLLDVDEVKLVENSPARGVLRVRKHFQNSQFVQDITLYPHVARVDVRMTVDWREKHILLKVAFPVAAHNDKATYEIPYGAIQRPTTRLTDEEKAMFEVPALRWADLSDAKHGFSLLNASKYGYDTKGNVVRMSLLRAPEWPDPHADEGHHEFTYSLYPHGGDWKQALTVRRGFELNYPLIAQQVMPHTGELPPAKSFASVDQDNVVLTAVKKAEDDDALIFRFYEWAGKDGAITLHLPRAASAAIETNLMEDSLASIADTADQPKLSGDKVTIPTKPYEIKTVKVTFAK